jgi:FkbM family methyltransferase
MNRSSIAKSLVAKSPRLQRWTDNVTNPANRGHRLQALQRSVWYDLNTGRLKRSTVVRIGQRSRIIAYPGETNSPKAAYCNPPNWEMFVWARRLHPGDLFVDIGANIGIYTIFALDLGAEVIAVEPTKNADRVREHLALNGYTAEVVQKAVTDHPGKVRITDDLDSLNHLVSDGGGIEVEATTLDDLLGDRTAAGVKIDVEGAERLVLAGASRALSEQRIRLLQIEWDPSVSNEHLGESREPLRELLERHTYRLYVDDERGGLLPVDDEVPDVVNIFAAPEKVAV